VMGGSAPAPMPSFGNNAERGGRGGGRGRGGSFFATVFLNSDLWRQYCSYSHDFLVGFLCFLLVPQVAIGDVAGVHCN
jgi:hypothetical protein